MSEFWTMSPVEYMPPFQRPNGNCDPYYRTSLKLVYSPDIQIDMVCYDFETLRTPTLRLCFHQGKLFGYAHSSDINFDNLNQEGYVALESVLYPMIKNHIWTEESGYNWSQSVSNHWLRQARSRVKTGRILPETREVVDYWFSMFLSQIRTLSRQVKVKKISELMTTIPNLTEEELVDIYRFIRVSEVHQS